MQPVRHFLNALTAAFTPASTAWVLTALFIGGGTARAGAQTPSASFAELDDRVTAGQTVYVRTPEVTDTDGRGIKGTVIQVSPDRLQLLVKGKPQDFLERDVLAVYERHTSIGHGAAIGFGIGLGLGLGLKSMIGTGDPESAAVGNFLLVVCTGVAPPGVPVRDTASNTSACCTPRRRAPGEDAG